MKLMIHMKKFGTLITAVALAFILFALPANAAIEGVTGTSPNPVFNLTAEADYITVPEGSRIFMWGYGVNGTHMQYPGPTLIVNQGDVVTVNLTNKIGGVPVSIVFTGQDDVVAAGGIQGALAREARFGETVTYTFTAANPGTYMYHSGSRPELATEMGLVGALIVRPTSLGVPIANQAYEHVSSAFNQEFLFLLTEMDPNFHKMIEQGKMNEIDNTAYFPVIWFINGRAAPDTMLDAHSPLLPNQPYNCFPNTHPGDRLLMRIIGAGRDMHPFHAHGNHSRVIARDGRLLESAPGSGAVTGEFTFTNASIPGSTIDAIFSWTGERLGWDIYGAIDASCTDTNNDGRDDVTGAFCHDIACTDLNLDGFDDATKEYCPDHGKPFPVILPSQEVVTFGQFYSGSPFLGGLGQLPPGEGGFNPNGGFFFMWHSHNEKEITSFDVFPGGMLTMMIIENPTVPLINP